MSRKAKPMLCSYCDLPITDRWPWSHDMNSNERFCSEKCLREYRNENNLKSSDQVNHPTHYNQGGIECIDAIQAALTPEEFRGFLKGNALKYVWRERGKGGGQDLEKAQWYLMRIKEGKQ